MSQPRSMRMFRGLAVGFGLLMASSLLACDKGGEMAILDVNPRVGSTAGDQIVQIMGKNFRQDIGYTIYFGTKKVSTMTIRDPETIEMLTPSGVAEGKVDIMIRADNGAAFRIPGVFTFQAPATGAGAGPKKEEKGNLAY